MTTYVKVKAVLLLRLANTVIILYLVRVDLLPEVKTQLPLFLLGRRQNVTLSARIFRFLLRLILHAHLQQCREHLLVYFSLRRLRYLQIIAHL